MVQKGLLGHFGFHALNSFIAWNMLTWMYSSLRCSEVKKWKFYAADAEEFINFGGNFPQEETHWLVQAANATHVPDAINSKI